MGEWPLPNTKCPSKRSDTTPADKRQTDPEQRAREMGGGVMITGEGGRNRVSREKLTLSIACSAASLTAGWRRRASAESARRSASSAAMKAISASASDLLPPQARQDSDGDTRG